MKIMKKLLLFILAFSVALSGMNVIVWAETADDYTYEEDISTEVTDESPAEEEDASTEVMDDSSAEEDEEGAPTEVVDESSTEEEEEEEGAIRDDFDRSPG